MRGRHPPVVSESKQDAIIIQDIEEDLAWAPRAAASRETEAEGGSFHPVPTMTHLSLFVLN